MFSSNQYPDLMWELLKQKFKKFKEQKTNRSQIAKEILALSILPLAILSVVVAATWTLTYFLHPAQVFIVVIILGLLSPSLFYIRSK